MSSMKEGKKKEKATHCVVLYSIFSYTKRTTYLLQHHHRSEYGAHVCQDMNSPHAF